MINLVLEFCNEKSNNGKVKNREYHHFIFSGQNHNSLELYGKYNANNHKLNNPKLVIINVYISFPQD